MELTVQELIELTALKFFSLQGFNETSTAEIAANAGVSEASIFRIYKTKKDLYQQVLSKYSSQAQLNTNLILSKITFENLEFDLEIIVQNFIKFYFDNIHITRIFISNAIQFKDIMNDHFIIFPQLRDFLRKYLDEMDSRGLVNKVSLNELPDLITATILQDVLFLTTFEKLEMLDTQTEETLAVKWKGIILELGILFDWHHNHKEARN